MADQNSITPDNLQDERDKDHHIGPTDSDIHDLEDALHDNYEDGVIHVMGDLSPADAAEILTKLSDEDCQKIIEDHSAVISPAVYSELDAEFRRSLLNDMGAKNVAAIIAELDSDDALDLIINLDSDYQQEIIRQLSVKTRMAIQEGLSFPEDSAGRLMQREVVAIPEFWTVGKTIDYLRAAAHELPLDFYDIFVISPTYHVEGEIPLSRILRAARSVKLSDLSLESVHPIPATMDQEHVAQIFRRENLTSAPVVDDEERLIGVITIDDVVDVIDEEAHEDFLKFAGLEHGDLYRAVLSTSSSRFRWLFINLLTAILASAVISMFDATIQQIVALAVLMPIVASMGGNAGTQALTVAVRALATREISNANAWRIIWKETIVGVVNGAAFAVIIGLTTWLWFGSTMLGAIIATAMILNLVVAGLFGAGIPVMLQKMGSDPAVSSTVVLTTVTDVVGFLAFLGLAALFLL